MFHAIIYVNTAVNERTGQSGADSFSSGFVQSAHRNPTATPGVSFDFAKVRVSGIPSKQNPCARLAEEKIILKKTGNWLVRDTMLKHPTNPCLRRTPEQKAILNEPNYRTYPTYQEFK